MSPVHVPKPDAKVLGQSTYVHTISQAVRKGGVGQQ